MAHKLEAKVVWKGEAWNFTGLTGSGYSFDLGGGANKVGGSPMEFLLVGVAGCTAVDVVSMLEKQRQEITGVEVSVAGDRAEDYPMVYTEVDVHYSVRGKGVSAKAVERAIALSEEKYCSASAMFQKAGVIIRTSFEVIED